MALHLYSIHHDVHGLACVERAATVTDDLVSALVTGPVIEGAVVLATCNRVELYVDAPSAFDSRDVDLAVAEAVGVSLPWRTKRHVEVLWHLFSVACGLDSMVIGEREIAGQLRRALKASLRQHAATFALTESCERALRTSRKVASLTALSATGRSLVSVALGLTGLDLASRRAFLMGTGSYAGASVAALRELGCREISVFSVSGRGEDFARSHDLGLAPELHSGLVAADLVICCRGRGQVVLTQESVAAALEQRAGRPLTILDMSLVSDVEAGVGELPGVTLIDLTTVQRHAPAADAEQVRLAKNLVAEGVREVKTVLDGRRMDPAVVALRAAVAVLVEEEVARLPLAGNVSATDAAHALRRLAARLMHVPSVRARQAATEGRSGRYLRALAEVYGINTGLAESAVAESDSPCPKDGLPCDRDRESSAGTCPVTGWSMDGLLSVSQPPAPESQAI